MPENSWPENESYNEPKQPSDRTANAALGPASLVQQLDQGLAGRRPKAATALVLIWSGTIALHLSSWGYWFVLGFTTLMGLHALRVLLVRPAPAPEPLSEQASDPDTWPYVSLLVAAKNEETVIGGLVRALCDLDYPQHRYDLWIINDNSCDRTGEILDRLVQRYPQLHVVHRGPEATGGKSGALNLVWPQTEADVIAVFDADAQVPRDLLRRVLPLFNQQGIGAVQVRKAVANPNVNFWTRGQAAEMALDTFFQQQRTAVGGIGELRGNGQFVRRTALQSCGGWNEATITDDLDLTLRLHLNAWDIGFLAFPSVREEGVVRALGLWHQRNRWAEGGYQRYLDYWRFIARNRLGLNKTIDLVMFMITQYVLPAATVPDVIMAVVRSRPPLFAPLTTLMITLSLIGMFSGIWRTHKRSPFIMLLQTVRGTLYMMHWLPVMASTTARMSVRPKRLRWVKTIHQGSEDDSWIDVESEAS